MSIMKIFAVTSDKVAKWTNDRNVDKLVGALTDKDPVIRRLAAEGMAQIRSREVLDYCRGNAQSMDQNVRWAITQILGLIGSTEAMSILSTVRDPMTTKSKSNKNV